MDTQVSISFLDDHYSLLNLSFFHRWIYKYTTTKEGKMKTLLLIFTLFLSQAAFSKTLQVMDVEYGFSDYNGNPTLCLTTYRDLDADQNIALVEDLRDCFWGRKSKQNLGQVITIADKYFMPIESPSMIEHLQSFDSELEFYYSEAE
jgi:hypothetical protein